MYRPITTLKKNVILTIYSSPIMFIFGLANEYTIYTNENNHNLWAWVEIGRISIFEEKNTKYLERSPQMVIF